MSSTFLKMLGVALAAGMGYIEGIPIRKAPLMELFLYLIGLAIWLVIVYVVTTYLTRRHYRPYWVQQGRDWRLKGYDRFISQYAWIQKYFDEGYYELDRIVEGKK